MDRRKIQRRLTKLRRELKDLERNREVQRRRRVRNAVTQISLVGYTNAGKSTLLNALTGAGVLVEDRLFSTLDPIARRLELPRGKSAVLIDTVGFVRKLPHQLVEAFRSTLEETVHADLLLHVIDASLPDADEQAAAVVQVLRDIGAGDIGAAVALNKADLLSSQDRERVSKVFPDGVFISARESEGLHDLLEAIEKRLEASHTVASFLVPFEKGDVRSALHQVGEVLEEEHLQGGTRLVVRLAPAHLSRFVDHLEPASEPH